MISVYQSSTTEGSMSTLDYNSTTGNLSKIDTLVVPRSKFSSLAKKSDGRYVLATADSTTDDGFIQAYDVDLLAEILTNALSLCNF